MWGVTKLWIIPETPVFSYFFGIEMLDKYVTYLINITLYRYGVGGVKISQCLLWQDYKIAQTH